VAYFSGGFIWWIAGVKLNKGSKVLGSEVQRLSVAGCGFRVAVSKKQWSAALGQQKQTAAGGLTPEH